MDDEKVARRGALKVLAGVAGAAACGAVAVPGLEMIVAPASGGGQREPGRWIKTVKLDALEDGVPKKVAIRTDARDAWTVEANKELGAVWLVRRGSSVTCFSATCPHLGCSIGYDAKTAFFCPCHDSAFTMDGKQTHGPSPRGLDTLATKIDDGFVVVEFRRYRQGTPERIEIG